MVDHSKEISDFKQEGNAAHQRKEYRQAIYLFSRGLELSSGSPSEHLLYSNRSAAYCLLEDFERALQDAETAIKLQPEWPRGYSRKGAALHNLKRYNEAIAAYQRGLELDPASDVMQKGMEDAQKAREAAVGKHFVNDLRITTQEWLTKVLDLRQLPEVIWHLEIIKDKIWLADPPKVPFRPRSLFIIDATRIQMLHMTAHPTRDSITLDELLDFLMQCCFKTGIRPGFLEFSDWKLQMVLEKNLTECGIKFRSLALSPIKQRFFEETIHNFEEKEFEQWKDNPKFSGVLRQRAQKGLLEIPGVSPFFLKYLLSAAALFFRSRSYLYYTKGLGIQLENGDIAVALITKNHAGQFGVAMSTLEESQKPTDCGTQSYLFADASNIPFDDADVIERNGWDIAEDRYPLPMLHSLDNEMHRPTLQDLKWYEVVFKVITLFVKHTFSIPTFIPTAPLCYRCIVHTHSGERSIIVTAPPSRQSNFELTIRESELPPPKEHLQHYPPENQRSKSASRSSSSTLRAEPTQTPRPALNSSVLSVSSISALETPTITTTALDSSNYILIPCEDTQSLKMKLIEKDRQNTLLLEDVEGLRSKLDWQVEHTHKQKELIDQLQSRVRELEASHNQLVKDTEQLSRRDAREGKVLISELNTHSEMLINALANSDEDFKKYIDKIQKENTVQRSNNLKRLSKPKAIKPVLDSRTQKGDNTKHRSLSAGSPSISTKTSLVSRISLSGLSGSINAGATPRSLTSKRSTSDSLSNTPRLFPTPLSARTGNGNVAQYTMLAPAQLSHRSTEESVLTPRPQDLSEREYLSDSNVCF